MPFEVKIDGIPAGYSLNSAKEGETCNVIVREFTSSEDGDLFISRLEGFPSELIGLLPPGNRISCSMIDNFLAIVRRDQTASLYVNEVPIWLGIRPKRDIQAGQAILSDDIASIENLGFVGVEIPLDVGIVCLFSQGWRKGLYYDLEPLQGEVATPRDYDFGRMMAQHYAYLGFQHLFKITDDEWNRMIGQGWFPFISMRQATINELIGHLRAGFKLDDLTGRVAGEFRLSLPDKLKAWNSNPFFEPHFKVFEKAVEEHLRGDYITSTSMLFPRLEGLMRTYHLTVNNPVEANSYSLVASVTEGSEAAKNTYSLFLPKNFRRFLKEVYFARFDSRNPAGLSRNTISHGVAPLDEFTLKWSLIGLLILDQLFFYMRPQDRSKSVLEVEGDDIAEV